MSDYIDKLTHSADEGPHQTGAVNFLGIPIVQAMAVPARYSTPEEADADEAAYIASLKSGAVVELPMTWWDSETCAPEPLHERDFALLEAAGIDPTDWEIFVIEEQLNRGA
jgi:hypothetical protein